jgi:hypothetical protein
VHVPNEYKHGEVKGSFYGKLECIDIYLTSFVGTPRKLSHDVSILSTEREKMLKPTTENRHFTEI